jgi:hypothetical protein
MGAYGNFMFDHIPGANANGGLRTQFGTILPPGVRVNYLRSTGPQSGDPSELSGRLYTTLNAALGECRSGLGDIVYALPGHTENIASADQMSNLVAGTQIIGCGRGNFRPTFTWTAAGSTFLLDVANVTLDNLILNMDPGTGTTTVAAPVTISAAGCAISRCKIRTSTDANSLTTIPITTTAAADDLEIIGNEIYGATAGECTTGIRFVGADRLKFFGNTIALATSSTTVGSIQFLTTASLDIKMFHNTVRNNKAASVHAITGMAGLTGEVDHLTLVSLANDNLTNAFNTPASLIFGRNVGVANLAGETAGIFGTVST